MASNGKKPASSQHLPQLIRVLLLKLEVQRQSLLAPKLTSEVNHEVSLVLLKPKDDSSLVRVKVMVSLDGKWRAEGQQVPLVSFVGDYEARFVFSTEFTFEMVEKWLKNNFYIDSLIAQAIPVVNLHMFSQLEMMGVNPNNKKIGYEPTSDDWKLSEMLPSSPAKRTRKKLPLQGK
ncbi:MAG: hypothetical protein Q8L47_04315 [bacterium]|nr:hypothetical protein [bacterium]